MELKSFPCTFEAKLWVWLGQRTSLPTLAVRPSPSILTSFSSNNIIFSSHWSRAQCFCKYQRELLLRVCRRVHGVHCDSLSMVSVCFKTISERSITDNLVVKLSKRHWKKLPLLLVIMLWTLVKMRLQLKQLKKKQLLVREALSMYIRSMYRWTHFDHESSSPQASTIYTSWQGYGILQTTTFTCTFWNIVWRGWSTLRFSILHSSRTNRKLEFPAYSFYF